MSNENDSTEETPLLNADADGVLSEDDSSDELSRFDAAVSGQLSFERDVIKAVHDAEMSGLTYREMVVVLDEIADNLETGRVRR